MFKYKGNPSNRKRTDYLVVHCAYTTEDMNIGAKEINDWHLNDNGWKNGIGYHFVIKRDGTIEYGRPINTIGAHVKHGFNNNSIAICLVGGATRRNKKLEPKINYTDIQYDALIFILENLIVEYPNAEIVGHNDLQNKICPVFNIREWASTIDSLKNNVVFNEEAPFDDDIKDNFDKWSNSYHPAYKNKNSKPILRLTNPYMNNPVVNRVQQKLYLPITGEYDVKTYMAIINYQLHKNLTVDGVVGPQTYTSLGI